MNTTERVICTPACPGVEVVTTCNDAGVVSTIHGGRLDGETFTGPAGADAESQHEHTCLMARMATWATPKAPPIKPKQLSLWPAIKEAHADLLRHAGA